MGDPLSVRRDICGESRPSRCTFKVNLAADSPPDGSRGGGYNSEYVTRNTVVAIMDVRALAERRDPFEIRIDVTE